MYMYIWHIGNIWSKLEEEEERKKIEKYFKSSCLRELKTTICFKVKITEIKIQSYRLTKENWKSTIEPSKTGDFDILIAWFAPSPLPHLHTQEKLGCVCPDIVCNWVIRQLPTYIPWTPHYLTNMKFLFQIAVGKLAISKSIPVDFQNKNKKPHKVGCFSESLYILHKMCQINILNL